MIFLSFIGIILLYVSTSSVLSFGNNSNPTGGGYGDALGHFDLRKSGNYSYQDSVHRVNPTPTSIATETGCHYEMDLVLVLDCSHSITIDGWQQVKEAAKQVINAIDVTPQGTHVSIIVYSSDVENFFMFDKEANREALIKIIDGLSFYGGWSRLDIALNAVHNYAFNPISGSRKKVPKVVVVFSDGNTDGAQNSADDVPDWHRIISKPIRELRSENITILAVACGLKKNNYLELNLIGGDKANVYNISDINLMIGTLMRTSIWNCPEKPKLCTSTPPSCRTSTTCLPQLSTCIPVIPPTKCTPITTTCRGTATRINRDQTSASQTASTTQTFNLQTSGAVPSLNVQISTEIPIASLQTQMAMRADSVEIIKILSTSVHQPVKVHTITVQPIIVDQSEQPISEQAKRAQPMSTPTSTATQSVINTQVNTQPWILQQSVQQPPKVQPPLMNNEQALQKIVTITEIRYIVVTAGSDTKNIIQSTSSVNKTIFKSIEEMTQTPSLSLSDVIKATINQTTSLMTPYTSTQTISTANGSASVTSAPVIKDKPLNRFAEENHKPLVVEKHSSWFDSFVPEFVRKWMAIEP